MVDDDGSAEDNASSTFLNMSEHTRFLAIYHPRWGNKHNPAFLTTQMLQKEKQTVSLNGAVWYVGGRTSQIRSSDLDEMFYNVRYVRIHQFNGWCKFPH